MQATATRTKTRTGRRLTADERRIMQNEALDRAEHGRTCANDLLIIQEFASRGIEAHPRVDCFTFNAWRALHRHVRKGEHGVHVPVYVRVQDQDKNDPAKITEHTVPTGATVFHISQTDPDEAPSTSPAPIEATGEPYVIEDPLTGAILGHGRTGEDRRADAAEDQHESELLQQEQDDERTLF